MRKTCVLCGKRIQMMVRKGSSEFCSRDCEKEWNDDEDALI